MLLSTVTSCIFVGVLFFSKLDFLAAVSSFFFFIFVGKLLNPFVTLNSNVFNHFTVHLNDFYFDLFI